MAAVQNVGSLVGLRVGNSDGSEVGTMDGLNKRRFYGWF